MRFGRIFGVVLALALLAGALPASAQGGNPTVTDEGNNIYLVDGTKGPIPNLLPAEEVQKIGALQSIAPGPFFVLSSPLSPMAYRGSSSTCAATAGATSPSPA